MEVLQSQSPVICWDRATACIPTITSQFSSNPKGKQVPQPHWQSWSQKATVCCPPHPRRGNSCPCCSALSRKQTILLAKHIGGCSVWIELTSFWQMPNQTQISEPGSMRESSHWTARRPLFFPSGPISWHLHRKISPFSSGDRLGSVPLT